MGLPSRYMGTIFCKKNKTLLSRQIESDLAHWMADIRFPASETPEM